MLIFLMWSLLPMELINENLFIFTAAGVVPCGRCKISPYTAGVVHLITGHEQTQ